MAAVIVLQNHFRLERLCFPGLFSQPPTTLVSLHQNSFVDLCLPYIEWGQGEPLEPLLQKQCSAGIIGVLSVCWLLFIVIQLRMQLAPLCFQVLLLAPVLASDYQDPWGFFQQRCSLMYNTKGSAFLCRRLVLLNSIRFLSACSPSCWMATLPSCMLTGPPFICKPNAINLYSKVFTESLWMTPQPIPVHVSRAVAVHKSAG